MDSFIDSFIYFVKHDALNILCVNILFWGLIYFAVYLGDYDFRRFCKKYKEQNRKANDDQQKKSL